MSDAARPDGEESPASNATPPEGDGDGEQPAEQPVGRAVTPTDPQTFGIDARDAVRLGGGVVVIVAAVAVAVRPSLVPTVGIEFLGVTAVGLVAMALGGMTTYRYLRSGGEQADLPVVEYRATVSVPGRSFDATLTTGETNRLGQPVARDAVTDRLRNVVTNVLRRTDADDPERAVDTGEWTDDPHATALFRANTPLSRADRLWLRLRGDTPFRRSVRSVVDAAARKLGVRYRAWDDPSTTGDEGLVEAGRAGTTDDTPTGDRETGRWQVVAGVGLLAVGLGTVLREPGLVLSATVAAGLLVYGYADSAPTPRLAVERDLAADSPAPGDEVGVTVRVENVGDSSSLDLRLVDGVPGGLTVVSGSPRHGTALRPGATATFAYTVEADRGEHTFGELAVVARDASGGVERTATVAVDGDDAFVCKPRPAGDLSVPVRAKTTQDVGRVVTDTGGEGLEFHSLREYRHGDPRNRIDWRRAARGEDLATMQFRVEHSARVVLLVDARTAAFVAPDRDSPSAVERSLGAAGEVFVGLLDGDDRVGLGSVAPERCWLPPGTGDDHWARARELLGEAFTRPDPDQPFYARQTVRELRVALPGDAQIVLFSPLSDDVAVTVARRLHAFGYAMTVVSPDATGTTSPGRTVAHLERRERLSRLRAADVRVVDWNADEPLTGAVERARERWSR